MEKDPDECGGKSIMDVFDDNILTEILLHLPTKIKFQCKAVCKRWFHLISTLFFAERVLAKEQNRVSLLWYLLYQFDHEDLACPTYKDLKIRVASEYNTDVSTIQSLILNFPPTSSNLRRPRVYAAHNGLILCSRTNLDTKLALFVCNPVTGKQVSLPEPQIGRWKLIGFMVSINNGISKFTVVRVSRQYHNNYLSAATLSNFEVFSSDLGEWSDTGVAFPQVDGFEYYEGFNGVVYDGKLIWRAGTNSSSLLAYDPDKNECRVLSFNVPLNVRFNVGRIGTCCGRLCYANFATNEEESAVCVCVLENYEREEWSPLVMTKMSSVVEMNESYEKDSWYYMMPLGFHPFDIDIVYFEMKKFSGVRIVSFNVRTNKLINFTGEEIPKGFNVEWPISVFVVPSWPTPVPQPIWETIPQTVRG